MKSLFMRIKVIPFALCILCVVFFAACSGSNRVVLTSADGSKKLIYDAGNFKSQVETPDDIAILYKATAETMQDAANAKAIVTVNEITDAMDKNDYRKLEQVVVEYRSSHKH
jgi:hypothetical protein